jgi:hypothetical protein
MSAASHFLRYRGERRARGSSPLAGTAHDEAGTPPALAEDERLALATRSNPTAFATLYGRHRESVFRFLRPRCTNDDEAFDLTAVTFERALIALPKYRTVIAGFAAWLLRIARNAAREDQSSGG